MKYTAGERSCSDEIESKGREPPEEGEEKTTSGRRLLIKLAVVSAAAVIVFVFVLGVHIHHGNSMYPFVMDGDLLVTYKLDAYRTGDVVLYKDPETGEKKISRIAASGTCRLAFSETGELLINGYVAGENTMYPTHPLAGSAIRFPYEVSEGGFFLLDDCREIGADSRLFGEITEEAILGKVVYVLRRRGI